MLKKRVITAVVLACLLWVALFWLPPQGTVLAFAAMFVLGAWEWAGFGALTGAARIAFAAGIGLLLLLAWLWSRDLLHFLVLSALACGWWAVALFWLSLAPVQHRPLLVLCCAVPVLVPAFAALARLQAATQGLPHGPEAVLWLLLLVFSADIGAFFAGRSFGRLKLAPRVSPGKTWEGAAGGMAAVAAVAWAGCERFHVPVVAGVPFGCAVGVYSIVGDLTESMFKRAAGLKDSGVLLPGHGGVLDRIDSVTAAAPLYALGLFGSGVLA
jgi:phosphatidate cytidylyltransferase